MIDTIKTGCQASVVGDVKNQSKVRQISRPAASQKNRSWCASSAAKQKRNEGSWLCKNAGQCRGPVAYQTSNFVLVRSIESKDWAIRAYWSATVTNSSREASVRLSRKREGLSAVAWWCEPRPDEQ